MKKNFIQISQKAVDSINGLLKNSKTHIMKDFWKVVKKYGTVEQINTKAERARDLDNQLIKLKKIRSPYLRDINWLIKQRDERAFISIEEYRKKFLAHKASKIKFDEKLPVVLEISAYQYFPWLISEARQAIKTGEIMPGRFIRVRKMKEQEDDGGDIIAVAAAMNIIGASYVETLDTRGTDGSNVHLGGPATITGYFGGVGQPNRHALQWLDEYLYYYTNYGITQVLNINSGTILLAYFLRQIGVKNEFKISVFMGNDNPYAAFSTLLMAKLFCAADNSVALGGLNFSNSADNQTIEMAAEIRKALDLESVVRFEHHITEAYKSIVRQPYNRRHELVALAKKVKNISAKHEGGEIDIEKTRKHPSDILDYFLPKEEIAKKNLMKDLETNFLDKHNSLNITARVLTENGIAFEAAKNLHRP